jgi:hypothetical protein
MHKNAMKCNKTLSKWCKNKHGASKIMDTLETYHRGERGFMQGESLASNLFTLLLFCLLSLLYFCLHLFIKNTKELVPFIVSISLLLLLVCYVVP